MSKFSSAMEKKSRAWNKARKAKPRSGRGFGPPDVPDGEYPAVITCSSEVIGRGSFKGVPVVRIIATISEGDHEGKEPSNAYFLEGKPPAAEGSDDMPTSEQRLAGDLKTLLPDLDVDNMDVTDLEAALDELNDADISCRIGVRNRSKDDKKYQDVYFNQLLEGGTGGRSRQTTAKDDDEPKDDDDEEPQDDEPEEDGDPGEAPAVGDVVSYKPPRHRKPIELEVKSVNQRCQTCNLNGDGKEYKSVPWDAIEILE